MKNRPKTGPIRRLTLVAGVCSCRAAVGHLPGWSSTPTRRGISASSWRGKPSRRGGPGVPRRPARHDRDGERRRRSDPLDRHVHRLAGDDRRGGRPRRPARRRHPEDQRRRPMDGPGPVLDRPRRPPGPRGPLRGRAALGAREGIGPGRIFLVGNRLYQAIMVGPASKVTEEELDHFVKSFELLQKVPATASTTSAPADAPAVAARGPAAGATPAARPRRPADRSWRSRTRTRSRPRRRPGTRARPNRNPIRRPARMPTRAPDRAEDRVVQEGNDGPDFLKPAAVAIEVNKPGGFLSTIPEPNGNPRTSSARSPPRAACWSAAGRIRRDLPRPEGGDGRAHLPGGQPIHPGEAIRQADPSGADGSRQAGLRRGGDPRPHRADGDAFQVIFMRYKDGRLDPDDSYTTNWLAIPAAAAPACPAMASLSSASTAGATAARSMGWDSWSPSDPAPDSQVPAGGTTSRIPAGGTTKNTKSHEKFNHPRTSSRSLKCLLFRAISCFS